MIHQNTFHNNMGGKARGLFELKEMGLLVPDFKVIPYDIFKPAIKSLDSPELAKERLFNLKIPSQYWQGLFDDLKDLNFPNQPVIVRSSIMDEDGVENSFAGLMDSFFNVSNYDVLKEMVIKCAASAYSERSISYRKQHDLNPMARPAVIIQQQIPAAISGVIFTTSPIYPQETAIHSVYGLGESLVNGEVAPDEFYYLKDSGKMHRSIIAEKLNQLVLSDHGEIAAQEVPEKLINEASITEDVLDFAFAKAKQIEAIYGPSDIEFCIQNDHFYFLQRRPITTTIPDIVVYDNSNIQESYCGVTTPLTFSFASRAYSTVYRQTMKSVGINSRTIESYDNVLNNLLALKNGRIYYNINNWYRGLQLLPSFQQNKADMEAMMGLEEPVDFVIDAKKSILEKIQMIPGLARNLGRLLYKFNRLDGLTVGFKKRFDMVYHSFYKESKHSCSKSDLLKQLDQLDALLHRWEVPIINDFKVMMDNGKVKRSLHRIGIKNVDGFIAGYLSGDHEIESAFPTREMISLAQEAQANSTLCMMIEKQEPAVHQKIKEQHTAFFKKVETFIQNYGDRTIGELKLETITMRLEPTIFYSYLKNLLGYQPTGNQDNVLSTKARTELNEKLSGKNFHTKYLIFKRLKKLQESIRRRESLRLDRTKLFGMYRSLYRSYGSYLVDSNMIDSVEDIFYLEEKEIVQGTNASYREIIAARRKRFERYESIASQSRIIEPYPPVHHSDDMEENDIINGQGCNPGEATGEVIIITNPTDNLDVKDKIIVAQRTDPGWCALFPACRGVIIEKGSMLSHSVILLRELNIPTIINVKNACKRLNNGQKITMDCTTGLIQIIE